MVCHAESEMKRKKAGNYLPLALIAKKANWFYNLFIVTDTNLITKEERKNRQKGHQILRKYLVTIRRKILKERRQDLNVMPCL